MRSATYGVFMLTLGLVLGLAGCKSEAEKQVSDLTSKQKDMVSVLKTVKDKDSAKAANVKLKTIAADLTATFEKMKKTNPSQEEQKRLMEKYKTEQEQTGKDIQAEMARISQNPELSMELMEGMMAISSSAIKAQMK
jgi:hypothetical protein